jgi:GNAT superfamily N-acetyltransferase
LTAEPATIDGEGVTLVPVRPGQAATLLGGDLDGRTAGVGWPHDDTEPALAFADSGGLTWLIVDADGLVVGELGTKSEPDSTGTVEIGYGLAARSRGRGLGTRAVAALLSWLERQDDVRRVIAHVAVPNVASHRLLARLGFRSTGDMGSDEVGYELAAGGPPGPR